jgi:hypothetical protein
MAKNRVGKGYTGYYKHSAQKVVRTVTLTTRPVGPIVRGAHEHIQAPRHAHVTHSFEQYGHCHFNDLTSRNFRLLENTCLPPAHDTH